MQGLSKLEAICKLQILVNNVLHNVELQVITLVRTDTTLDLSQKAEKSITSNSMPSIVVNLD